jgi:hypothetical protein
VAPPPPLGGCEPRIAFHGVRAAGEEIVEVDQAAPHFFVLVAGVEAADSGRRRRQRAAGAPDGGFEPSGGDETGLGPLDVAGEVRQRCPGQCRPARRQRSQQASLALEQGRRLLAPVGPPAVQLGRSQGVKRPGVDLVAEPEPAQPVLELAGGLPREGHRQRVPGLGRTCAHPIGDAPRQDPGLARAGRRQQAQRGRVGGDRRPLGGGQASQQVFDVWMFDVRGVSLHGGDDTNRV